MKKILLVLTFLNCFSLIAMEKQSEDSDGRIKLVAQQIIENKKTCDCGFNTAHVKALEDHLANCDVFLKQLDQDILPEKDTDLPKPGAKRKRVSIPAAIAIKKQKAESTLASSKRIRPKQNEKNSQQAPIALTQNKMALYKMNYSRENRRKNKPKIMHTLCACREKFNDGDALEQHIKDKYAKRIGKNIIFFCPVRDCAFKGCCSIYFLLDHFSSKHTGEAFSFRCQYCSHLATSFGMLDKHEREHKKAGSKKIQTSLCIPLGDTENNFDQKVKSEGADLIDLTDDTNQAPVAQAKTGMYDSSSENDTSADEDSSIDSSEKESSNLPIIHAPIDYEQLPDIDGEKEMIVSNEIPEISKEKSGVVTISNLAELMLSEHKACCCGYNNPSLMLVKLHLMEHLQGGDSEEDKALDKRVEAMINRNLPCFYCGLIGQNADIVKLHLLKHLIAD